MASKNEQINDTAGRELMMSRELNAPRELVWKVFTEPEHIAKWWGPDGFTNTISKMEVKPGGAWDLVMHGPDGTDYVNKKMFTEVDKPLKLVFEHINWPKHITTINFEDRGEKTEIRWHMVFETKEVFEEAVKTFKADEGLKQNLEKLERYFKSIV